MLLALLVVSSLTSYAVSQVTPSCSCSSGFIPVPVDVTIPVDPSNPQGLNSTDTMRLKTTFNVYGELCEPVVANTKFSNAAQLLLHGQTYNTQYWDVAWGGFQNYSYVAHSCQQGITSFAYDNLGNGRTLMANHVNSSHCQIPVAANISSALARDLKNGRVSQILAGTTKRFQKVVGFGHSLGSATLNLAAINDGSASPFDGLVLTGSIHDPAFLVKFPVVTLPASIVNPGRWANLDPGYVTTPNISERSFYYGPDNSSFSPTVLQLDELTKDAGSRWMSLQISQSIYTPAIGFNKPVVELVGSFDQVHCLLDGAPCDAAKQQPSEAAFFPDAKNFTMITIDGFGHDVNLEFGAAKAFPIYTQLFESWVG